MVGWHPPFVLIDYEMGLISAVRTLMPNSSLGGCYFHFAAAVYRKIVELGYKTKYDTVPTFRYRIRCLSALAFLPVAEIPAAFQEIAEDMFPNFEQDIIDYFEKTWKGWPAGPGYNAAAPSFPMAIWSVHVRQLTNESLRTNNAAERFHFNFSHFIVCRTHPTMLDFIEDLKKQHRLTRMDLRSFIRGDEPTIPLRYRRLNTRLANLVARFLESNQAMDLVRGVASAYIDAANRNC